MVLPRLNRLSSRPTLAKARGEPEPIATGGDHGSRFRGDDLRRIHWVRFAKNDVGFVSPKGTSLSYPGRSAARKMASDAFVACRDTCWLVRSLYFPVFLQIRNLPSRSHDLKHTHLHPSRGAFLRPGFASLLHSPRIEGWAERRETFGCVRSTRGTCTATPRSAFRIVSRTRPQ